MYNITRIVCPSESILTSDKKKSRAIRSNSKVNDTVS